MVKRTFIGFVKLLGGLGAGLAIIALLIAWQLQKGAVSLSFLTPYVEQALNSGHRNFKLAIDDTTLTWAGWDRTIELRVKNVRAIGENGAAQALIPELSMSLSGRALLRGDLAPKFIELLGPEIRVLRRTDGELGVEVLSEKGAKGSEFTTGLLSWLVKKPEPGSPMSFLETVRISGATVTYEDQLANKIWQAPVGYLRLDRAAYGLLGEGSVLIEVDGQVADISLHGSYHTSGKRLDMSASFIDITPASFAGITDKAEMLRAFNLPLSGSLFVGMSIADGIESVGFKVTGTPGVIDILWPLKQTLVVDKLDLNGIYIGASERLTFDEIDIVLASGSTLTVPDPIAHTFPLKRLTGSAKLDLQAGTAEIENLTLDLNGPIFGVTANADGINQGGDITVTAEAAIKGVPFDQLTTYWPVSMGGDAYTWVTTHLAKGQLTEALANVKVRINKDGTHSLDKLEGTMSAEGVEVTYLEGMPPVNDVKGLTTFDADTFNIVVESGQSNKINLTGADIKITGLRNVDQFIDIDLHVESPVSDALGLIDREPFGFASAMKIDPKSTLGDSKIDLSLKFLLAKDLAVGDVDAKAKASLTNVSMEEVVLGRGIRNGELTLEVNTNTMAVDGNVLMGDVPVALIWNENFSDRAAFRSIYLLAARIDDLSQVRDLGVDLGPVGDFVSGGVDATVRYTVFNDRISRVDVNANLERAELRVPVMEWRKAAGDAGGVDATILLENGLVKSVPEFNLSANDLLVQGDVAYSPGGLGIDRVNLKQVLIGRSDVTGAVISRPDGGWEIGLQGKELDFSPLWERLIRDRPGQDDVTLPNLTIAVELDKMWVDKQNFLSGVSGTFVHNRSIWRTALLDSKINGGSDLSINMVPDAQGNRILAVKADNAGDALRFFDLFDNMYGGVLEISGRYDDAAADRPLRGTVRVTNYRVRNAPMLTRILSFMSLTGILDAMTGEGLSFAELNLPFTYTEGEVQIKDVKAAGASIGFTASGTVYTHADVLNIQGTVIPAYALNSFLGQIPLLGNILTGNEKGGGIFAANFSVMGPIEDPKTTVNPLSALTPGILRNLFGALKTNGTTPLGDDAVGQQPLLPAQP